MFTYIMRLTSCISRLERCIYRPAFHVHCAATRASRIFELDRAYMHEKVTDLNFLIHGHYESRKVDAS